MASASAGFDESIEITTRYAVEEKKKLKKSIGRLDILFFLLCTIVGFDTIGATAASGAQAFTWLIFLGISSSFPTLCSHPSSVRASPKREVRMSG